MHYGIVGIGPVGAIFAAHLNEAGHRVSVVDLNLHRNIYLAKHPLTISGKLEIKTQLTELHGDMGDFIAGDPDVILICTKSCQSLPVLKLIKAYGPDDDTVFVSCQNGIDVEEHIADVFGDERAYRMILHLGCNYVRKAEVWVEFAYQHYLSERGANPIIHTIAQDFSAAGIATRLTPHYKQEALRKAILNTSLGSICALTHLTMSEVMEEDELVRMVKEITREGIRTAKAMNIDLGDDYLQVALEYLGKGGDHKPSMLVDIEQKRMTENEHHAGMLFRYAEKSGLNVPVIQTIYYLVKNLEHGVILGSHVSEGMKGD